MGLLLNKNNIGTTVASVVQKDLIPLPKYVPPKQANLFVIGLALPEKFSAFFNESSSFTSLTVKDEPVNNKKRFLSGNINLTDDNTASQVITAFARTVNVPGDNVNEVEIPNPYTSWYVGGRYSTDTISVTFADTIGSVIYRFFRSWLRMVCDPISLTACLPTYYKTDMIVAEFSWILDDNGKRVPVPHTIHGFEGVFPTSVAGWSLDVTSDDVITFDVTFRFDRKFLDKEIDSDIIEGNIFKFPHVSAEDIVQDSSASKSVKGILSNILSTASAVSW